MAEAIEGAVHLLGLVSDGGVHSLQSHLHKIIDASYALGAKDVFVHAILDGRDTPPRSAGEDIARLLAALPRSVPIATVSGRYYAMDRDGIIKGVLPRAGLAVIYGESGAGKSFLALVDDWEWQPGLCVEDARFLVRLANIDTGNRIL